MTDMIKNGESFVFDIDMILNESGLRVHYISNTISGCIQYTRFDDFLKECQYSDIKRVYIYVDKSQAERNGNCASVWVYAKIDDVFQSVFCLAKI